MSIPTLDEWRRKNPGRGVNEYFKKYPRPEVHSQPPITPTPQPTPVTPAAPIAPIIITTKKKKRNLFYGNILFSILILIGFFLPWIKVEAFKFLKVVETNGMDIPKLFDFINPKSNPLFHQAIYAIPAGALISLLGEFFNKWMAKLSGQFISLLGFCYLMYLLYSAIETSNLKIEYTDILAYGFYMTALGIAFYVFDMFFGEK